MPQIISSTISATFLARTQATPDVIGFQYKPTNVPAGLPTNWRTVTFKQFHDECAEIGMGLLSLGIGKQNKIVILSNTRYEWALCDMAIIGIGAVTIPIYPSCSATDMSYIINHSESVVAIVEDLKQLEKILKNRANLPDLKKIIVIDSAELVLGTGHEDVITLTHLRSLGRVQTARRPQEFDRLLTTAKPEDIFTICYTSGTTGVPKGAILTHDNMVSVLEDAGIALKNTVKTEEEILVTFLPFSHILGRVEAMATFLFGWRECYAENIDKLMQNIGETSPTMLFAVPRIFEKAYARITSAIEAGPALNKKLFDWATSAGRRYFTRKSLFSLLEYTLAKTMVWKKIQKRFGGRLTMAICGGAPLPREIGEFFQTAGIKILEGYGLTETCAPVAINTPEHMRFGSVGRPLTEVKVRLADDGEICLRSRKVFKGYHKQEAESAEAIQYGWFHTGDIGFVDQEGFLHITDRKKDLIVTSGGKNIAPQKIENLAKSFSLITQLVVYGDRRNYLTALVTIDHEQVRVFAAESRITYYDYSDLINHPKIKTFVQKSIDQINQQLASFETIKKFTILPNDFTIESGELTPSLKIKRNVISKKFQTQLNAMYDN